MNNLRLSSLRLPLGPTMVLLLVVGCIPSDLQPSELAGQWQLLPESKSDLGAEYQDLEPRLDLHEDGTFVAEELPGEMVYLKEPWRSAHVSGTGRWKIVRRQYGEADVALSLRTLDSGDESRLPHGLKLQIARSSKGYDLFYFRGDPDDFDRVFFHRDNRGD